MAIISTSESMSTFDSANSQRTQELFPDFSPAITTPSRQAARFPHRPAGICPDQADQALIDSIAPARTRPVRSQTAPFHIHYFPSLINRGISRFLELGSAKSPKSGFPAKFAWFLPPHPSDNKPAPCSFNSHRAGLR